MNDQSTVSGWLQLDSGRVELHYKDQRGKSKTLKTVNRKLYRDDEELAGHIDESKKRHKSGKIDVKVTLQSGNPSKLSFVSEPTFETKERPQQGRGNKQKQQHGHPGGGNRGPANLNATAPYNFIECKRPAGGWSTPTPGTTTFSGTIACSLEALTPIIIGNPTKEKGKPTLVDWVTRGGVPFIPGSSLKGMVRGILESLSFSGMGPTSDIPIATRDVASSSGPYRRKFNDHVQEGEPNGARAGFLKKAPDGTWIIEPCRWAKIRHAELQKAGVNIDANTKAHKKASLWYQDGQAGACISTELETSPSDVYDRATLTPQGMPIDAMLFTGPMYDAKRKRHVDQDYAFYRRTGLTIPVPPEVYLDFEDQMRPPNCRDQREVLEVYRKNEERNGGIPVFWLPDGKTDHGSVAAIGLCRYFRLASIHRPINLVESANPRDDFCKNLFGSLLGDNAQRGRAWCTAGELIGEPPSCQLTKATVLGQPQITATGMYLEQDHDKIQSSRNETNTVGMNTWDQPDNPPKLRGRKQYWHRTSNDAAYPDPPQNMSGKTNFDVQTKYKPAPANTRFAFQVHLDGVTEAELGGILMALELEEGHAHKLGGGKAVGHGSVRVQVDRLAIQEDMARYSSLTNRIESSNLIDKAAARNTFVSEVAEAVGFDAEKYEDQKEIRTLRAMTDFEHRPSNALTSVMPVSTARGQTGVSYKQKSILKTPLEIAGDKR